MTFKSKLGTLILAIYLASALGNLHAQVESSGGVGCSIGPGIACDGPGGFAPKPTLWIKTFTVTPGFAFSDSKPSSDLFIIGIEGGTLVNEEPPFRHVNLEKGHITLLPRDQPFVLRNSGAQKVSFKVVEVER